MQWRYLASSRYLDLVNRRRQSESAAVRYPICSVAVKGVARVVIPP